MGQITRIELNDSHRAALEQGYRQGANPAYRRRCQMVLLKSQGRSSQAIAQILGGCDVVVNNWVRRYQEEGLAGLQTRPGRGRPPILESEKHRETVRQAVAKNRQRLSLAKAELEAELGREFCTRTLTRFVKKTVQNINECGAVPARSQTRRSINSRSSACSSSRHSPKVG
jgi:transposase